jgi:hypothetical protein
MARRLLLVLAAAFVAGLVFTSVAAAEEVSGTGTIHAAGRGVAIVQGTATVDIQVHGIGMVFVKGAEALVATGQGRRTEVRGGVLFTGWKGQIHIEGRDLNVRMAGGRIEFTATGTGWVYLQGNGVYRVEHRGGGLWSPRGHRIHLGDPAA